MFYVLEGRGKYRRVLSPDLCSCYRRLYKKSRHARYSTDRAITKDDLKIVKEDLDYLKSELDYCK